MFELQALEQRVLLSAEGLAPAFEEPLWTELKTAVIVENATSAEDAQVAAVAANEAQDDWFPAVAVETRAEASADAAEDEAALAASDAAADSELALAPAVIAPTAAVFAVETDLPVSNLPNGPPVAEAQVVAEPGDVSAPPVAADTLGLAATFTTALADLDAALATWGAFFDLGTIDWAGLGLDALSLPVLPDSLNNLFDLNTALGNATLPDFSVDETIDAFVSSLNSAGFAITAIQGGYNNGSTTIAATTGTSLLEGSYTLAIGSGMAVSGAYAGDTFNDSTAGVLSGLASGANLDGTIAWSGDLSLSMTFVLDSASGLLLSGNSALLLTVTGTGSLTGSGTAGGAATSFTGTAGATLGVALGFIDPASSYTVSDFTTANIAATASGTATLSLAFAAGPTTFTFGGSYTVTANLPTRTVTQGFTLSLAGQLTLPGVTESDGSTAGVIALSGAYDSGTDTWTITGSATGLQLLGLDINSLTADATVTAGSFSGTFAGSLTADFLSDGSSPAQIDVSATYDRSAVSVTGTIAVATLNFNGTGSQTLLTATDFSGTVTMTGDIDAGTLTGSLALSAGSAALMPGSSTFTASITDGDDVDTLGFSGSYDFNNQVLAIAVDQLDVIMPDVLTVSVAGLAVSYDRKNSNPAQTIASAATVTVALTALQESGSDPPTATVSNLTVRQNGFAFDTATLTLGDHTIGGIVEVGSLEVTLTNVDYTVGETPSGTLGLTAASATLFPGAAATATLTDLSGQFDVATKAFALTITSLDAQIGSLLTFTATGIAFGYDPTGPPGQVVFSVDTLTATVPSTSVTGTLTGLEVTAAGNFSAVSLTLDTSGLTDALGIGEFLPFSIESMTAVFAGDTNGNGVRDPGETFLLNAFDLTVTGSFDFEKLGALPFTPILQIGESSIKDGATNTFSFTISVDSSGIKPKDIGPITIGFSDLNIGSTATMAGSITLGGYQNGVFNPDFSGTLELVASNQMGDVSGSASITLTGTFSGGVLDLTGVFNVSFTYGEYVSVTNASLGFAMTVTAGSGFLPVVNNLALTSGSIESVTLTFGSLMTLSATSATFDFTATGSAAVATFGSMSVTFPGLGDLTGTATNFGFAANGTLITNPGFGVSVSASSSALKWPDWVPISITALAIRWNDFAADPLDFQIVMSASVTSLNGLSALTVSGTVEGVVIDIGLLKEGRFPITDLDAVAVSISGSAFGGEVSGTLIIGILKLDADGNVITSFDTTPVAERILYGAVEAGFEFGGTAGFSIRIGVSELGPLQIYLTVSAPVILEPISGLAITNFRAGVQFNTTLPDITDPFALKDSAFTPADELTLDEWLAQLQTAVANQAKNPPGSFWDAFTQPIVIQGGATFYSAYASTATFRADIDILFDTEGRVVVNARGTFADSFSMNFRLYANLTEIQSNGTFLFLAEEPEDPTLITYYGALQFKFLDADGNAASSASQASSFYLSVSGGAIGELEGVGSITLDATLTLTITSTKTEINFSGSLTMSGLGQGITTAGTFVIEKVGGSTKLYGVAVVAVSFEQLESKGIFASGVARLQINTTGEDITTTITLPGGSPTDYTLDAATFAVIVTGSLQVQEGGSDWFYMEGLFVFALSPAGLDLLVDGSVLIGDKSNPTATLSTQSYFAIRSAGVAAKIDLTLVGSFGAGAADIAVDATFQLLFNTTSQDVTYNLPSGVTLSDGSTSVTVSGTSPNGVAEPYLFLDIRGSLTVANTFELTDGQFTLIITPSLISLEVVATFVLKAGNTSLLTFGVSGGFQIAADGVAAVLTLTLQVNAPSSQGWSIDGEATMQFNTRDSTVTITNVALPKDTFRVAFVGALTVGEFELRGGFDFTVSGNTVNVSANATAWIFVGSTQILKLSVSGGMSINSNGLAAVLVVSLDAQPSSGSGWSLSAAFQFQFNTRSSAVTIAGTHVAAHTVHLHIDGTLSASGFSFQGTFLLTVTNSSVVIAATASISVAGISLNVTGDFGIFSNGIAFKLSLSISQLKTSIITVKGTFTIAVNTTSSTQFGIARKSGYLEVSNVQVTLAGFTISGSLRISSDGTISVPSSDPLTLSIIGQTARFYGWVNLSNGQFDLTASINISIGSRSVAQISGSLDLNLYRKSVNGRITAGLNGTFSASLYAFNIRVINLTGTTSISSDGSFSLSVSASFTIHSFVSVTADFSIAVDSSRNVSLSISGTFKIFNKFSATVGGWANSANGHWKIWGSASASFGNSSLGSRLSVSVSLSNYTTNTVSISGSAWAKTKIAGITFGISGSFSATLTGETASVNVSGSARAGFIKVHASKTVRMNFRTGQIWLSDIGGALVYFDANRNGRLDDGEPFTYADADGVFTFDEPAENLPDVPSTSTLLAELDLNGDGLLTADEGMFVLSGGTALSDGTPNTSTITLENGALAGLTAYAGATVFIDTDFDGERDAGEFSVTTADDGSYSFGDLLLPVSSAINHLGRLESYDTNGNGAIDPDEGVLVLTGGATIDDGTPNTGIELLGSPEGHTIYAGATVFLDLNGNHILDANEPSTVSAADGFYHFDDHRDAVETAQLGDLAPYDTNQNGFIDAAEGMILVTGGRLINEDGTPGEPLSGTLTLDVGQITGPSGVADGVVFLDVNGNGVLDAGEPAVATGDNGYYSFNAATRDDASTLGLLTPFDLNGNGEIDSDEGMLVFTGGTRIDDVEGAPVDPGTNALLEANEPAGVINRGGATVFLDRNGNGQLDAGEVSTTSDEAGFYSFLTRDDMNSNLGALEAYDLNDNGVLDPGEGVFIIEGGTDLHTGLPNDRTLTVLAVNYGTVFGTQLSPLSELFTYLVLDGMSQDDANSLLISAFGLPPTTNVLTFDPDLEGSPTHEGESTAKLISIIAETGGEVLLSLAELDGDASNDNLTLGEAENFVVHALAQHLVHLNLSDPAPVTDAENNLIAAPPAVTLHDEALLRDVLLDAIALAGLTAPGDAILGVVVTALHNIADRVDALQDAALPDITGALARMNSYVKQTFHPALDGLFSGATSPAAFAAQFTPESIRDGVRLIDLQTTNTPPTVAGLSDQSVADYAADRAAAVNFTVGDADGLPDEVFVSVASSNPFLLPGANVSVSGEDAARSLAYTPVAGRWGTATISVIANDGQSANGNDTTIVTITITVRYTYAEFMATRQSEARAQAAAQDEDERAAAALAETEELQADLAAIAEEAARGATSVAAVNVAAALPGALEAEVSLAAAARPRALRGL